MKEQSNQIQITAQPNYILHESDPATQKYLWSYEISVTNNCSEIIQLLNRYWLVTDMTGKVEEIYGFGVVGLQPLIKPGKKFVYTSYCQLTTPQGTMEGFYEMQNLDEQHFKVEIPKFILSAPSGITQPFRSRLH